MGQINFSKFEKVLWNKKNNTYLVEMKSNTTRSLLHKPAQNGGVRVGRWNFENSNKQW